MDTPAGTGRHLETPATSVYFVNSLANANTGGAVSGMGPNVYAGTLEWCRRATASPKVIIPLVGGWAVLQKSLPLQTGTPPRPGYVTEAYHFAPHPGLWLRGAKVSLNGASHVAVWHLRSYMGDDETGISVANRDPMGSGYSGGTVTNIAAINCELAWSCDELLDMYYSHDGVSLVDCAFVNPLHETALNPSEDHGFGPMMGGGDQFGVAASFRCLWANITDRAPFTNSTAYTHANNLHFNHGRPGGGAGYAVRLVSQAATEAELANILGNGFVRGPENNGSIVAVATTSTLPAGSQGYMEGNAAHGWSVTSQDQMLATGIEGYRASARLTDAYPAEWGENGVLRWHADPNTATQQEWLDYVDLMGRTVGAQPGWRMPQFGKVGDVLQSIRDTINGNMPPPQFSDSVADEGGWFEVPEVGPIDPLDPGQHWHAPFPTTGRDDVLDGSATWGSEPWIPAPFRGTGLQLAGRTVLERWIILQHWYTLDASTRPPLPQPGDAYFSMDYSADAAPDAGWGLGFIDPNNYEGARYFRTRVAAAGPSGQDLYRTRVIGPDEFGIGWHGYPYTAAQRAAGDEVFWRFRFRPLQNFAIAGGWSSKILMVNAENPGESSRIVLQCFPWENGYVWRGSHGGDLICQTDGGHWDADANDWMSGWQAHTDWNQWSTIQLGWTYSSNGTGSYKIWRNNNDYENPTCENIGRVVMVPGVGASRYYTVWNGYNQMMSSNTDVQFDACDFQVGPTFESM